MVLLRIRMGRSILSVAVAVLAGCSDGREARYPVSGKLVTADGTPFRGRASVTFHIEKDGKDYFGRGKVQSDGSFRLTTFEPGDGAVAGEHKVTVSHVPGGEETAGMPRIAEKYGSTQTSGLTARVEAKSNNEVVLTVDRPK